MQLQENTMEKSFRQTLSEAFGLDYEGHQASPPAPSNRIHGVDKLAREEKLAELEEASELLRQILWNLHPSRHAEMASNVPMMVANVRLIVGRQVKQLKEEAKLKCYEDEGPFISYEDARKKAAEANLGFSGDWIRNAVRRGELRSWLVDSQRYVSQDELNTFLEDQKVNQMNDFYEY